MAEQPKGLSEGYYWVKIGGNWTIGEFEIYKDGSGCCWNLIGDDRSFYAKDLEEIGEKVEIKTEVIEHGRKNFINLN